LYKRHQNWSNTSFTHWHTHTHTHTHTHISRPHSAKSPHSTATSTTSCSRFPAVSHWQLTSTAKTWWLVWRSGNGIRHINDVFCYVEPG